MNAKINFVKINNGNALTTKVHASAHGGGGPLISQHNETALTTKIRKGLSGNHNETALKIKVRKGR